MSEVWQGPGWWQASDGKWYPMQGQPYHAAPPPTCPSGHRNSVSSRFCAQCGASIAANHAPDGRLPAVWGGRNLHSLVRSAMSSSNSATISSVNVGRVSAMAAR
jgi:hypothetical protein